MRIGAVVLRLALTIGLLALDASLVVLALVQILCLGFDFTCSMMLIRRRYPDVRVRLADFDWRTVRRIVSFSLYVLLLSAGARLSFETDALVIGAFLSVGAIPFYAVANNLVVYLMDLVIAIAAVVAPMATKLKAEGREADLEGMFLKWSKVALSISIMAGVFLMVLGPAFIGWWIDPSFAGPSGAVPNVLFAVVVLVAACRELGIGVSTYLRYVVPRAALGAVPLTAWLVWCKAGLQVQSIGGLVGAGSAMLLLFGATWVLFVYRDDPFVDLRPHLGRLRAAPAAVAGAHARPANARQ